MTKQNQTHSQPLGIRSRWLRVLFCLAILWGAAPARAETWMGKPFDGSDSLPISPAGSKRSMGPDTPVGSSFTKPGTALVIVVVGITVALTLTRKFFPSLAPDSANRIIQVLGQSPLGTKGTVYIVRCGPRVLIVGATTGQLTTLAEIADLDEIDEFVRLNGTIPRAAQRSRPDSSNATAPTGELKGQVDGMLDRIDSWKASV